MHQAHMGGYPTPPGCEESRPGGYTRLATSTTPDPRTVPVSSPTHETCLVVADRMEAETH